MIFPRAYTIEKTRKARNIAFHIPAFFTAFVPSENTSTFPSNDHNSMKSLSPLLVPRMRGVKSLPMLSRPWLFQPNVQGPLNGRLCISNLDLTHNANSQQRSRMYLYHRVYIVFIAFGIIFLTSLSIMISFGKFQTSNRRVAFDPRDSESFQCKETSNMSPWIQTPVHDRRFFPQYNQLSDFLDGHASVSEINSIPSNEESGAAVCVFRTNIKYWNHFPHT